jgi:tRNA-dihydrouridine synthase B
MNLLDELRKNPFLLAPMAGITDCAFRTFMRSLDCGIVISELVSAHGLEYKSPRTTRLMEFEEMQRPVGVQLFGETPEILAKGAQIVQEWGADFVDLNFGCPVPKVVKKGAGSAILKDLVRVGETFRAVKAAVQIPVTVKIRTGWDEAHRNAAEVAEIAYNEGLTWVAIHGRTRAAGYSGLADWDYIQTVQASAKLPIIGNGDIATAAQAVERLEQSGCAGVMIGRGCLKNPWIFREARAILSASDATIASFLPEKDFLHLFVRLRETFARQADEKITMLQLRKFASWYSSGYPGSSQFRKAIFQTGSIDETMEQTLAYFTELKLMDQADTSKEAFLMGGHG